jgi:DNA-binding NtrC family response regulator
VSKESTILIERAGGRVELRVPTFTVEVVKGPDEKATVRAEHGRIRVGTGEGVELRLSDKTVSRFHAELCASERGIVLRDLGSTNGTTIAGVGVTEVVLSSDAEIRFGGSKVRLRLGGAREKIETSDRTSFGAMIGGSAAMRRIYAILERAAPTTAPVLVTGESGTGKELAARAVHDASPRRDEAFEVVDCGGLPATLIESELFGHEKGAFTHATHDRPGAFERADGGTLFLDELGELPLDLQPKLLRALGEGEVRRLGSRQSRKVDVRIVAATNRDLRREVNAGNFRSDLFYRLAVIQCQLPPLRERLEDLSLLVPALAKRIAADRGLERVIEVDDDLLSTLEAHHWPGNIRELRNHLEQLAILDMAPELSRDGPQVAFGGGESFAALKRLPLTVAKTQLIEAFERDYLESLLDDVNGNVAEAARRAGVDRGTLFRTIRRYGMKVER